MKPGHYYIRDDEHDDSHVIPPALLSRMNSAGACALMIYESEGTNGHVGYAYRFCPLVGPSCGPETLRSEFLFHVTRQD